MVKTRHKKASHLLQYGSRWVLLIQLSAAPILTNFYVIAKQGSIREQMRREDEQTVHLHLRRLLEGIEHTSQIYW